MTNLKNGNLATANTEKWEPASWPQQCRGIGFTEAPRGALGHWASIRDQKIDVYQCVVPTTWNASPRDPKGQIGALRGGVDGHPNGDTGSTAGDPAHLAQLRPLPERVQPTSSATTAANLSQSRFAKR